MLLCLQPSMDYLQDMQSTHPRAPDYNGPWVLGETVCRWLIINDICVYYMIMWFQCWALNTFKPVFALSLAGEFIISLSYLILFQPRAHVRLLSQLLPFANLTDLFAWMKKRVCETHTEQVEEHRTCLAPKSLMCGLSTSVSLGVCLYLCAFVPWILTSLCPEAQAQLITLLLPGGQHWCIYPLLRELMLDSVERSLCLLSQYLCCSLFIFLLSIIPPHFCLTFFLSVFILISLKSPF